MKSISYKCKCGNMIELVSQYIEDELLEDCCNVRCCKCGTNTSFNLIKTNVSNSISLDVLRSKDFQIANDMFTRMSKFDNRLTDIWRVKSSLEEYDLTKRTTLKIKEDKDGNTYNEICVYVLPDTELLISIYQKRFNLEFKEMLVNQFVYELEVKQQ